MTNTETTAPPGRVYSIPPKVNLAVHLSTCQGSYRHAEGREPLWCRVHSSAFERFDALWTGHIVADDRIRPNNLMLGRD